MLATSSRCQRNSVAGVTKKAPNKDRGSSREQAEQHPIGRLKVGAGDLAAQDRDLATQHQQLDVLDRPATHPERHQPQRPRLKT